MAWAALLSAGLGMAGGSAQQKSAAEAGKMTAAGTEAGTQAMLRAHEEAMALGLPYREAGRAGLDIYQQYRPGETTSADIYRIQKGEDELRAMQAARGYRKGGAASKELSDFYTSVMEDMYNRTYGAELNKAQFGGQFVSGAAQGAQQYGQGLASTYMAGAGLRAPYIAQRGQNQATTYASLGRLGGDVMNYAMAGRGGGAQVGEDFMYGEEF